MRLFILDKGLPPKGRFKEVAFLHAHVHAKRFFIDGENLQNLLIFATENWSMLAKQIAFAKPPFPEVFIEFNREEYMRREGASEDDIKTFSNVGFLIAEGKALFVQNTDHKKVGALPHPFFINLEDGEVIPMQGYDHADYLEFRQSVLLLCLALFRTTIAIFLLMSRPGMTITHRVPLERKVIRGKLRTSRAHDVLKIDLAPKELRRAFADGSRGSGVREHEVRGHWMHWRLKRSCEHQWQKVEVEPFAPERWECPLCASIRVWRKDHARGDSKRGNKFHTYEVAHSGLDPKPKD